MSLVRARTRSTIQATGVLAAGPVPREPGVRMVAPDDETHERLVLVDLVGPLATGGLTRFAAPGTQPPGPERGR